MTADSRILADVLAMVDELAGDWEYDGEITPDTFFLADMGLESLDLVVLGTMVQQRYGRLPFAEYLAEIGGRPVEERDITVAELVAFIGERHAGVGVGEA
ncbi:MAG TPA: acyl carrier protein [Solirubrobacteraceae bacterium]|nr:acyl carrier protein [Solirubrobacteraceae bacterium]